MGKRILEYNIFGSTEVISDLNALPYAYMESLSIEISSRRTMTTRNDQARHPTGGTGAKMGWKATCRGSRKRSKAKAA